MHVDRLLHGLEAKVVRRAVDVSAFHPAAREPGGEAVMIVIAPVDLAGVRARRGHLDRRRASEFAAADDERLLEQAALFQVFQKRADRLVALAGQLPVIHLDVVVVVPRLTLAVPNLHEAHAALDEPPRDENLPRLRARTVHVADVLRLLRNVEGVGGVHLHAVGQFEGLHARLELRVGRAAALVLGVELREQIELRALRAERDVRVADVLDEPLHLGVFRVDVGALIDARQERRLPVLRLLDRVAAGAHRDEPRHVLILAAEPVAHPRTKAGPDLTGIAAIQQQQRRLVIRHVGVHRADDADVVDALRGLRENLAHFDPALPVFFEVVRRLVSRAGFPLGLQMLQRDALPVHRRELRFRVKGVHVRRSAVHEQVDDALRFAGKMRRARRERIEARSGVRLHPERLAQDAAQRERAHAHAASGEEVAAGEKVVGETRSVMGHRRESYAQVTAPAPRNLAHRRQLRRDRAEAFADAGEKAARADDGGDRGVGGEKKAQREGVAVDGEMTHPLELRHGGSAHAGGQLRGKSAEIGSFCARRESARGGQLAAGGDDARLDAGKRGQRLGELREIEQIGRRRGSFGRGEDRRRRGKRPDARRRHGGERAGFRRSQKRRRGGARLARERCGSRRNGGGRLRRGSCWRSGAGLTDWRRGDGEQGR